MEKNGRRGGVFFSEKILTRLLPYDTLKLIVAYFDKIGECSSKYGGLRVTVQPLRMARAELLCLQDD